MGAKHVSKAGKSPALAPSPQGRPRSIESESEQAILDVTWQLL
ncbi:MAG: hypothetical protein AAGD25_31195 [Cyanobacteria bacterium P01_F01_bin.150]